MPEHKRKEFELTSEADFGHTVPGVGRFRVNVFRQRGMVGLAIRRVRSDVPTIEELFLPPVMARARRLLARPRPRDRADRHGQDDDDRLDDRSHQPEPAAHIVTIEDPIEVVHDDDRSIIQQREIGLDTDSYSAALKHVIRQDPDVIFVGEIRDPESALSAIQAAETGHLVISHAPHDRRDRDDQPSARPVPAAAATRGPNLVRRRAPRHRVATSRRARGREGPDPGRRGARRDRTHLRSSRRPGARPSRSATSSPRASSTACRPSTRRS